jgi:hypothetical protein
MRVCPVDISGRAESTPFNLAAAEHPMSALPKPTFRNTIIWAFAWLCCLIALQTQPNNNKA